MSNQTADGFVEEDNNPWTQGGDYEENLPAPEKSAIQTRAMTRNAKSTTVSQPGENELKMDVDDQPALNSDDSPSSSLSNTTGIAVSKVVIDVTHDEDDDVDMDDGEGDGENDYEADNDDVELPNPTPRDPRKQPRPPTPRTEGNADGETFERFLTAQAKEGDSTQKHEENLDELLQQLQELAATMEELRDLPERTEEEEEQMNTIHDEWETVLQLVHEYNKLNVDRKKAQAARAKKPNSRGQKRRSSAKVTRPKKRRRTSTTVPAEIQLYYRPDGNYGDLNCAAMEPSTMYKLFDFDTRAYDSAERFFKQAYLKDKDMGNIIQASKHGSSHMERAPDGHFVPKNRDLRAVRDALENERKERAKDTKEANVRDKAYRQQLHDERKRSEQLQRDNLRLQAAMSRNRDKVPGQDADGLKCLSNSQNESEEIERKKKRCRHRC